MIKKLVQNKRNILTYLITLIVSGAKLMTGTSPFGIAAFGAAAANKVPVLIPFIGITTITLLIFGPMAMLKFIISAILFVVFKAFLKNDEENKMSDAIKMLVAVAISESIGLFMTKTLVYDSLLAIYSAITSAIFYLIFASGISTIVDYGRKKAISSEDMIASCVLLTVAITLLGEASIFGVSIRGVLSVLMVMLLGWKCGPCIGATSGIATSLVLGIMGYGSAVTVATYGFSGLLSGVFAKFGKIGAGIGFILGNMVHDAFLPGILAGLQLLNALSQGGSAILCGTVGPGQLDPHRQHHCPVLKLGFAGDIHDHAPHIPGEAIRHVPQKAPVAQIGPQVGNEAVDERHDQQRQGNQSQRVVPLHQRKHERRNEYRQHRYQHQPTTAYPEIDFKHVPF